MLRQVSVSGLGLITKPGAGGVTEGMVRVGQDFSNQHLADQKLPPEQRQPYTIVIAMRSWLMAALAQMQRRKKAEV